MSDQLRGVTWPQTTPKAKLSPHEKECQVREPGGRKVAVSPAPTANMTSSGTRPRPPPSDHTELSIDVRAPGLLKIFGESVVAGARYKSVLASTRSTAQELIKQALERYGLPARLHGDFVLCESVGRTNESNAGDGREDGPGRSHVTEKVGKGQNADKSRRNRVSSPPSLSSTLLSSSSKRKSSPRTPRSARSSLSAGKCKANKEKSSSCATPRSAGDSPRTPLGSPRTTCGSPSTSRGSPRASECNQTRLCHSDREQLNYRPPKVYDLGRSSQHRVETYDASGKISRHFAAGVNAGNDSHRIINNILKPNDHPARCGDNSSRDKVRPTSDTNETSDWTPVSLRVLARGDRPLELQDFWKPPEGLSRRFELRRRCDVTMNAVDDDTIGLNDNARKIMMSKVSPGVIPFSDCMEQPTQRPTTLKEEWDRASMMTNATLTYGSPKDQHILTNIVEGDTRQAYVCPSIFPYLLTLRECSIQKDLVLYPLKSRSVAIGSAEKKSQSDDIRLSSDDILPLHCRVSLKRLPQDGDTREGDQRQYWYCLDLDIYGSSHVTVNGVQMSHKATVYPGDILGIGRQYLFLYKDPTGGHDTPSAVPWLPAHEVTESPYARVYRNRVRDYNDVRNDGMMTSHYPERHLVPDDFTSQNDHEVNELDDSAPRDAAIFLAYHRDKEVEVLEAISEVSCSSPGDYPHSVAVLYLAAQHYAARKFSGDHQSTFFKRMVRVIRARGGVLSKSLSQQKHESTIFAPSARSPNQSETDYFPSLVTWLSNVMALLSHFRTSQFHSYVSSLARRSDITTALQEAVHSFEETVTFLFQQTVYSVTKVLYDPINHLMHHASQDNSSATNDSIGRILDILQATQRLANHVLLHTEVTSQLMVYLLFFISTTLFNRVIAKGSKLYNRESGAKLQEDVSSLEKWAKRAGLEAEFVRVSEHIMSLTDLLASSKRSLVRLDWANFQKQFSPLTDAQLCKVLAEYHLEEGQTVPPAWYPPYAVDVKQDLTLSLSSHPQFIIPNQALEISLSDTFPPTFFKHLEQVQQRLSLVGEDVYCSGLSSAGNTPRLSESLSRPGNLATFFSMDSSIGSGSTTGHVPKHHGSGQNQQDRSTNEKLAAVTHHAGNKDGSNESKPMWQQNRLEKSPRLKPPPPPPPKPTLASIRQAAPDLRTKQVQCQPAAESHGHLGKVAIQDHTDGRGQHPPAPPPYNVAVKSARLAKLHQTEAISQSVDCERKSRGPRPPIVHQQSLPEELLDQRSQTLHQTVAHLETLPNRHKTSSKSNQLHPNIQPASHHHTAIKPRPYLQTQHSWAHTPNTGLFQRHAQASSSDLASSYPLARPRPSSASDYLQHSNQFGSPNGAGQIHDQLCNDDHQDSPGRYRSNSALGNKSRYSPHLANPAERSEGPRTEGRSSNKLLHKSAQNLPQNYKHVKDSTLTQQENINRNRGHPPNQHGGNRARVEISDHHSHEMGALKRSPGNQNLSARSLSNSNISAACLHGGAVREEMGRCDILDQRLVVNPDSKSSTDTDGVPPPLPPKGELLKRRTSVDSQKSIDSGRSKSSLRKDSDPHTSTSSSNQPRSGSRTSVEIQDITENQYILYNPNLPVKNIFDKNQNLYNFDNKNSKKDREICSERKILKVPPLDLPDDLLGTSEPESPDDVFSDTSGPDFNARDNSFSGQGKGGSSRGSLEELAGNRNASGIHSGVVVVQNGLGHIDFALRSGPRSSTGSDKYPDDIYIDVEELDSDPASSQSSLLKVLPVDESVTPGSDSDRPVSVRYRHTMPDARDIATKGEVTGEVFTVILDKAGSRLGMGLIDGLHTSLKLPGIYVRNVLPDTPAALCGCIRVGDRILAVNGKSIVGADYLSAMKLIRSTGPRLNLLVAKCDRSVASKVSASST